MTSKENLALNLIYDWLGITPKPVRSFEEWEEIAGRIPKLEALHAYIDDRLRAWDQGEIAKYEICYFKAGDRYPHYEDFPTSISKSTIRSALVKSGLWELRP
jgi:hypothetical protein